MLKALVYLLLCLIPNSRQQQTPAVQTFAGFVEPGTPEYIGCFYENADTSAYQSNSGCEDYQGSVMSFNDCHQKAIQQDKLFFTFTKGDTCRVCNKFSN